MSRRLLHVTMQMRLYHDLLRYLTQSDPSHFPVT
nr:MAG TPA: hypothetical protein [Caudoviricetes sp.]